jgi:hypothetical protein
MGADTPVDVVNIATVIKVIGNLPVDLASKFKFAWLLFHGRMIWPGEPWVR